MRCAFKILRGSFICLKGLCGIVLDLPEDLMSDITDPLLDLLFALEILLTLEFFLPFDDAGNVKQFYFLAQQLLALGGFLKILLGNLTVCLLACLSPLTFYYRQQEGARGLLKICAGFVC